MNNNIQRIEFVNKLIKYQDIPGQMKIRCLHSTVAYQCAILPNLLVFPNFLVARFDCCREKVSVNFSMTIDFRFDQFGSIVSRDE